MSGAKGADPHQRGEDALARNDWSAARDAFREALLTGESARSYEGLSWAALALDDGDTALFARRNAYRLYRAQGDAVSAARMAMWAGKDHEDFRGEPAVARGWRERARRLLQDQPVTPEHGWLALFECWEVLAHGEDPEQVRRCASDAMVVSRQCNEPDMAILALAMDGLALVSDGRVGDGMRHLDEAAAAALAGELQQPIWELPVLCWLIYACERVRDFDRAGEWCEMMRGAAERLQHTASQGICRTHYATVLASRGRWREAESTLAAAAGRFRTSWPPQTAEATVRLADLRRRQGQMDEAEALLRPLDWHPLAMLGLAEIALETGRAGDAEARIATFLRHIPAQNRLERASAQELLVRIHIARGDQRGAADALADLSALAGMAGTLPLQAAARFAEGLTAGATGDLHQARVCCEDAVALYERSGIPFEAAHARLELAETLNALGHSGRAREEAGNARHIFEELGARGWLQRADALLDNLFSRSGRSSDSGSTRVLTARQIDVLRLVAEGRSDAQIAASLHISPHTVHRHIANILLRLDAPTRTAAATRAVAEGLID